jgi:hypothetical protein
MIDPGDSAAKRTATAPPQDGTTDDVPAVPEMPASKQSIACGKPSAIDGASGRRARLRHPARGAVRR